MSHSRSSILVVVWALSPIFLTLKFMVIGPAVQAAGVVYRQSDGTLGNIYGFTYIKDLAMDL